MTLEGNKIVVMGTSGSTDYLHDATGTRRFWPLTTPPVDLATLRVGRAQLWAEAAEFWNDGVDFMPVCEGLHENEEME